MRAPRRPPLAPPQRRLPPRSHKYCMSVAAAARSETHDEDDGMSLGAFIVMLRMLGARTRGTRALAGSLRFSLYMHMYAETGAAAQA